MSNSKNCSDPQLKGVRAGIVLPEKDTLLLLSFFTAVLMFMSCGPSKQEMEFREKSAEMSNSIANHLPAVAADTINGITHYFLKTADIKCRVTDVIASSERIKHLVKKHGGYLIKSELQSHTDYSRNIPTKKDSVLHLNFYTTTNTLILRAPTKALDTLLGEITSLAVFINHNTFKADDAKMQMYANVLAEKRYDTFKKSMQQNVKTSPANLTQINAAEENVLQKQRLSDEAKITGYELAQHVNYSTVTLELYQSQRLEQTLIVDFPDIESYNPTFTERLKTSGSTSLEILIVIVLFFVKLWAVLLLLFIGYLLYRRNRGTKTSALKI